MVMIIGFLTMGALVWVLVFCLARESEADKRRMSELAEPLFPPANVPGLHAARQAA